MTVTTTVRETVREYLLEERRDAIEAVLECADEAAGPADGLDNRLRARLQERNVLSTFPDVLRGAVRAAGRELPATPVAAPPYVVVTSVGPTLRATVADGRLVITVRVFRREEGRYVRTARTPEEALVVELR